jgi:hypothetical protein
MACVNTYTGRTKRYGKRSGGWGQEGLFGRRYCMGGGIYGPQGKKQYRYASITATPEKLWGEVPGQKLAPIISGIHGGGFFEYPGQVLENL